MAQRLINAGVSAETLKVVMRHRDFATTERFYGARKQAQSAAAEMAQFGLPNLTTFSANRIDRLITNYNALPSGDSTERRNLARRIGHLLSSVSVAKRVQVQADNPGEFTQRVGTLAPGWTGKEVF